MLDAMEQDFTQEMKELMKSNIQVHLVLSAPEAWIILAQLQLALRHPLNNGASSDVAHRVVEEIASKVACSPRLRAIYEAGWDPDCDQ